MLTERFLDFLEFLEAGDYNLIEAYFNALYPAQAYFALAGKDWVDEMEQSLNEEDIERIRQVQLEVKDILRRIYECLAIYRPDLVPQQYVQEQQRIWNPLTEEKKGKILEEWIEGIKDLQVHLAELPPLNLQRGNMPTDYRLHLEGMGQDPRQLYFWLALFLLENQWWTKLGRCPYCKRFFRRSRQDQVFCSRSHKNLWGHQR